MGTFGLSSKFKPVVHEITMVAFTRHPDGGRCVYDIIETSNYHAPHFARKWLRDSDVVAIGVARPGTPWDQFKVREVHKGDR